MKITCYLLQLNTAVGRNDYQQILSCRFQISWIHLRPKNQIVNNWWMYNKSPSTLFPIVYFFERKSVLTLSLLNLTCRTAIGGVLAQPHFHYQYNMAFSKALWKALSSYNPLGSWRQLFNLCRCHHNSYPWKFTRKSSYFDPDIIQWLKASQGKNMGRLQHV